jgi:hypothetical protein
VSPPSPLSANAIFFGRTNSTFFKPTEAFEITGQVGNVCFLEGMVFFKGKWLLYYGTADSKIAVAEASMYDYRGMLDHRAKARREAAALEREREASEEEVFLHLKAQEAFSRKMHKVATEKQQQHKEEEASGEEEEEPAVTVINSLEELSEPKASPSLDVIAEEL